MYGEVLVLFSLRSADTSSLSSVWTLSIEPFSRRTWNVFGPDPGVRSKSVHAALFPDRRRTLHLFAGRVDLAAFPGDTVDSNPALAPTYCCNAETCDGVPLYQYDFVLADPPYSTNDAERYGQCMVNRNKVVQTLSGGLPEGAFIVWLDQVLPMYRKAELKIEAVIGIVGSTNHRFRVLTVLRRL
jgi:hypothetical protein